MKVNLIHCIENWMIPCFKATLLLSPGSNKIIADNCGSYVDIKDNIHFDYLIII